MLRVKTLVDRQRLNVVCTEAPGVVVYTDPAMEDEADMDELREMNYGAGTLTENERIHYVSAKIATVSAEIVRANW
jgi:hypothetical protein